MVLYLKAIKRFVYAAILSIGIVFPNLTLCSSEQLKNCATSGVINIDIGWLSCDAQLDVILHLSENRRFKDLIILADYLMSSDWGRDKMLLYFLSFAQYSTGNFNKSILYMEENLKSNHYFCQNLAPIGTETLLNEAETRYILSDLYNKIGDRDKAKKQLKLSKELAKQYFGKAYSADKYKTIIEPNAFR